MLGPGQLVDAQQVNVIINHQWPILYAEVQQMPHVVFSSSFQTQPRKGFATPWFGEQPFCLSISEDPFVFSTDAKIVTPEDVKQNRQGAILFSLPRDVQIAAQILQASGWGFYYSMGGYHVTLLVESIWMDPGQIVRCKGYVVVTADPSLLPQNLPEPGLSDGIVWVMEKSGRGRLFCGVFVGGGNAVGGLDERGGGQRLFAGLGERQANGFGE